MHGHVVAAGVLHTAEHQHLRATGGHLEHFLVADRVELLRVRHDARVGGVDAVHVGVDLAHVGLGRGRERHRGGVAAATAERGDLLRVLRDALEAGDDRDRAVGQRVLDPARCHVDDAGFAVHRCRDHAGLRPRVGPRLGTERVDRHREQRHRDPLTRGEQHVELTCRRYRGHLAGEVEQFVGRVTHGGDHDDHVVARFFGRDDSLGHAFDPLGTSRPMNRRTSGRRAPPTQPPPRD